VRAKAEPAAEVPASSIDLGGMSGGPRFEIRLELGAGGALKHGARLMFFAEAQIRCTFNRDECPIIGLNAERIGEFAFLVSAMPKCNR
jgi:hypothetical protein